jgi:hypothetical protein
MLFTTTINKTITYNNRHPPLPTHLGIPYQMTLGSCASIRKNHKHLNPVKEEATVLIRFFQSIYLENFRPYHSLTIIA